MTHHCFFEMVTSLPNRHFHQALYKPLLLTARTMWSITTKMIDKRELLLPFLWRNLRCSPGLLTTWKVCGCALWWQSEVRVGVFMSQCMVGICSLFDGCSHFPCAGGRKKKMAVYFRMSDFRPRSSMNTAAYKLRGELCRVRRCTVTFRVVFLVERGSEGVWTVCLWWEARFQEIGIFHIKQSSKTCAFSVLLWKQEHRVTELSKDGAGNQPSEPWGKKLACSFISVLLGWLEYGVVLMN